MTASVMFHGFNSTNQSQIIKFCFLKSREKTFNAEKETFNTRCP